MQEQVTIGDNKRQMSELEKSILYKSATESQKNLVAAMLAGRSVSKIVVPAYKHDYMELDSRITSIVYSGSFEFINIYYASPDSSENPKVQLHPKELRSVTADYFSEDGQVIESANVFPAGICIPLGEATDLTFEIE